MTATTGRARGRRAQRAAPTLPTRWWRRMVAGGVTALLLGGVVATLVARSYDAVYVTPAETPIQSDRIEQAVASLSERHVYVTDDGRDLMDLGSQERLEERLAALEREEDLPVRAVVWAPTAEAGYDPSELSEVAREVTLGLEEEALVVVWQGPGMAADNLDVGNGRESVVAEGDPAQRIAEFAERVDADDVPDLPDLEVGTDTGAGVALGATAGLAIYGVLVGILGLARVATGRRFLVPGPFERH